MGPGSVGWHVIMAWQFITPGPFRHYQDTEYVHSSVRKSIAMVKDHPDPSNSSIQENYQNCKQHGAHDSMMPIQTKNALVIIACAQALVRNILIVLHNPLPHTRTLPPSICVNNCIIATTSFFVVVQQSFAGL